MAAQLVIDGRAGAIETACDFLVAAAVEHESGQPGAAPASAGVRSVFYPSMLLDEAVDPALLGCIVVIAASGQAGAFARAIEQGLKKT